MLIPVSKPDAHLPALVLQLGQSGFGAVVVVDDGSPPAFAPLFDDLKPAQSIRLLRHQHNQGKGRALKTAMAHVLQSMPHIEAVITADADGQHTAADIVRIAQAVGIAGHRMVLGVRAFTGKVPLRCRVGNATMRAVFQALTGVRLADTQSGLRGIPRSLLAQLILLPGERYEYEIVQLAYLCSTGRRPQELPIDTLYLEGNQSSHFKPLRDSMRILFALARSPRRSRLQ